MNPHLYHSLLLTTASGILSNSLLGNAGCERSRLTVHLRSDELLEHRQHRRLISSVSAGGLFFLKQQSVTNRQRDQLGGPAAGAALSWPRCCWLGWKRPLTVLTAGWTDTHTQLVPAVAQLQQLPQWAPGHSGTPGDVGWSGDENDLGNKLDRICCALWFNFLLILILIYLHGYQIIKCPICLNSFVWATLWASN